MLITASQNVVFVFGIAVCVFSVWGLFTPARLCTFAIEIMDKSWGIWAAVFGRLFFGVTLVIAAPASQFPHLFNVLGLIAIAAAAIIPFMGRGGLRSLAAWFGRLSNMVIRVWLLFALAFGAFLIYGIM